MYGSGFELAFWSVVLLGSPLLALYGLAKYQPLHTVPKSLVFVALSVFVIAGALIFAFRKKMMPWGEKAPFFMWSSIFCMPILPTMAGVGLFLVANGVLDQSHPRELQTVIVRVGRGKRVTLHATGDTAADIAINLSPTDHDNVERGDSVGLMMKSGALGLPWMAGYKVHRMPLHRP
jgi:hypothetical protein